jgi:ABC-2 type transport system permease protein
MSEPAPVGTVHDLGYKRYAGSRRTQGTRWQVIARHQVRAAWKTFWRFKLPLLLAVLNTTVFGILMSQDQIKAGMRTMTPIFGSTPPEDLLLFMSYGGVTGWYDRITFIASLFIAAGTIAGDTQSGAFQFYFARPVRTFDYVLGKLAGLWFLFALILIGGPLILAGIRLGMYGDGAMALANVALLGKVVLIGALGALAYAAVPLAISALVPNRRYGLAMWATYWIVVGTIMSVVGATSNAPMVSVLDISGAIQGMAFHLFDISFQQGRPPPSLPWAIGGLLIHAGAAIVIIYVRVARARSSGVGGTG